MRRRVWCLVLLPALLAAWGCGSDEPTRTQAGPGLKILLPEEAGTWETVKVELWDDNGFLPAPTCPGSFQQKPGGFVNPAAAQPPPDECTKWKVEIWNLIGERVRFVPETKFEGTFRWNTLDDEGEPVPSGIYPTLQSCLDSNLSFDGHYFVNTDAEEDSCEWIVWSAEGDPSREGRELEYFPFPPFFSIESPAVVEDRLVLVPVFFESPYLVRVRGPGGEFFEREINLVDEELTEVRVSFPPPKDAIGRN